MTAPVLPDLLLPCLPCPVTAVENNTTVTCPSLSAKSSLESASLAMSSSLLLAALLMFVLTSVYTPLDQIRVLP